MYIAALKDGARNPTQALWLLPAIPGDCSFAPDLTASPNPSRLIALSELQHPRCMPTPMEPSRAISARSPQRHAARSRAREPLGGYGRASVAPLLLPGRIEHQARGTRHPCARVSEPAAPPACNNPRGLFTPQPSPPLAEPRPLECTQRAPAPRGASLPDVLCRIPATARRSFTRPRASWRTGARASRRCCLPLSSSRKVPWGAASMRPGLRAGGPLRPPATIPGDCSLAPSLPPSLNPDRSNAPSEPQHPSGGSLPGPTTSRRSLTRPRASWGLRARERRAVVASRSHPRSIAQNSAPSTSHGSRFSSVSFASAVNCWSMK